MKQQDQAPSLDEVLRELKKKLNTLWKNNPASSSSPYKQISGGAIAIFVAIVLFFVWFLSGVFIVNSAEKAIILHFGRYTETKGPGLHWVPVFVYSRYVVNVEKISTYTYHTELLTKDNNIAVADAAVQYRIDNIHNYLFHVSDPKQILQQATASVVANSVQKNIVDQAKITDLLQQTLAPYQMGIVVTDVTVKLSSPLDTNNDAVNYANQAIAQARDKTAPLLAAAKTYQEQMVANAKTAVAPFLALLPIYKESPEATRERLYTETMQNVLTKSSVVFLDVSKNSNIVLPIEKMVAQVNETASSAPAPSGVSVSLFPARPSRPSYSGNGAANVQN